MQRSNYNLLTPQQSKVMEISNYQQVLDAKDIILRKMDTCKKLELIERYDFDLSVWDGSSVTVKAYVNRFSFGAVKKEWSANVSETGSTTDEFNEDAYNDMSEYLDGLLEAAMAKMKANAVILNAYYEK